MKMFLKNKNKKGGRSKKKMKNKKISPSLKLNTKSTLFHENSLEKQYLKTMLEQWK